MNKFKRAVAIALVVITLVLMLPVQSLNAAIIPGEFDVNAGTTLKIYCNGMTTIDSTNIGFRAIGNTIATVDHYSSDNELLNSYSVYLDDYDDIFYYRKGGEYFDIKVKYGTLRVVWNMTEPKLVYGECESYDKLIELNIKNYYTTVGDKNKIQLSWSIPGAYVAVEDEKHVSANDMGVLGFGSTNESVVTVDKEGNFEAVGPGEAEITSVWRIGKSSSSYRRFHAITKIYVSPDYDLNSAYENYYAANDDRYFNIIADGDDDRSENGFNIIVGDETYNTGEDHQMLITFPENFREDVIISKKGYHSYTLKNSNLASYNWITLYPDDTEVPFIEDVFAMALKDNIWQNLKVQMLNVTSGANTVYQIDLKVNDPHNQMAGAWLQQGSKQLPLNDEYTAQYVLGQQLSSDAGAVYVCVLTTDGIIYKKQILINVLDPKSTMELNFNEGDGVGGVVDENVDGIGKQSFSFGLTSFLPIEYEVDDNGNVKGTIGIVAAEGKGKATYYEDIKETIYKMDNGGDVTNKSLKDGTKIDNLTDYLQSKGTDVISSTKSVGIDGKVTILGFFEGKIDEVTSELKVSNMGVAMRVSGKVGIESQSLAFVVPYYWKISLAAEIEAKLVAEYGQDGDLVVNMPPITFTVKIDGNCSVGLKDVGSKGVGIGVGIKSSLKVILPEAGKGIQDSKWILNCSFYNNVSFGVGEYKEDFWVPVDNYQLYPKEPETQMALAAAPKATRNNLAGTDFLSGMGYAYDSSSVQVLSLGEEELVVWVGSESGGVENDNTLYYALYNTATGVWSEVKQVYTDSTPDFSPVLKMLGSTPTLVWQNSSLDYSDEYTLEELALSLDIYYATFNKSTLSFKNVKNISEANGLHDTNHDVLLVGDTPTVVWSQNTSDNVYNGEAVYKILCASYKRSRWTTSEKASDIHAVSSLAASASALSTLRIRFTADTDDDYYTNEDVELFTVLNGIVTQNTENDLPESMVSGNDGGYWLTNGTLTDSNGSYEQIFVLDSYVMLEDENGVKAAVFSANDEKGENLYAIFDDGYGFGDAIALTEYENNTIISYSAYFKNGKIVAYSNILDSTGSYGFVRSEKAPEFNLSVEELDYDKYTLTEDGILEGRIYAQNNGSTTAKDLCIKVKTEEGEEIYSAGLTEKLLPGKGQELEFKCSTDLLLSEKLYVSLESSNSEKELTDNRIELNAGIYDISVEKVIAEKQGNTTTISAFAVNRGLSKIGKVKLTFRKDSVDGEVVGTAEAESIPLKSGVLVSLSTEMLSDGDMIYVCAEELEGENISQNNYDFTNLPEALPDTSKVITEQVQEGLDDFIELNKPYTLNFKGNVTRHKGKFIPEESGYYSLNYIYDETFYYNHWHSFSDLHIYPEGLVGEITEETRPSYKKEHAVNIAWLEAGVEYSIDMGITDENDFKTLFMLKKEAEPDLIYFSRDEITLKEGESQELSLVYSPEESYCAPVYKSSDSSIAEVDESGRVYAKNAGEVSITASVEGTELTAECKVKVVSAEKVSVVQDVEYTTSEDIVYSFIPQKTGYYKINFSEPMTLYRSDWSEFDGYFNAEFLYTYLEKGSEYYLKLNSWMEGTLLIQGADPQGIGFDREEYEISQLGETFIKITGEKEGSSFDGNTAKFSFNNDNASVVGYEVDYDYDGIQYCVLHIKGLNVGSSTLTVATPDGGSASRNVIINPCKEIELKEEVYPQNIGTEVYIFTPEASQYYYFDLDYYLSVRIVDSAFNPVSKYHDAKYYLEGGKSYYVLLDCEYPSGCLKIMEDNYAEELSLDPEEYSGNVGSGFYIYYSYSPEDCIEPEVSWYSTDESVATVNYRGYVSLVGYGSCDIVYVTDNGLTAKCKVFCRELESISVHSLPDRTEYVKGFIDSVDLTGLELKLNWTDGGYSIWSYDDMGMWFEDWRIDLDTTDFETTGKVIVGCGTKQTSFKLNIVESNVKSISIASGSIADVTEKVDGYNVDGRFIYSYYIPDDLKFKITYTDSSTKTAGIYETVNGYYFNYYDDQYNSPWQVGKNYFTVTYLDASVKVPVNVVKNPVKSVTLNSAPTREYVFGDKAYGEVYEGIYTFYTDNLDLTGIKFTVNMTDGTKKTFTHLDLDEFGRIDGRYLEITPYYTDLTGEGVVKITVRYMGYDMSFDIKVKESSVKSISSSGKVKVDNEGYYTPDFSDLDITLNLKDSTKKTLDLSKYSVAYDQTVEIDGEKLFLSREYDYENDSYYYEASYLGVSCILSDVEYVDHKKVTDVSLENVSESCKGLKVTLTYEDKTSETLVFNELYSEFNGYDSEGEEFLVYAKVGNKWLEFINYVGKTRQIITLFGISTEITQDEEEVYENPFTDVKPSHWFAESVEYCVKKGYVKGMTETTFVPNGKLTRAQFLTMLASLDGVDLSKYETANSGFSDVKTNHWYNKVVCWAVEQGITSGLSADKFGPNNNVTRAQLARFFYVYSEKNGISIEGRADISAYPDVAKVQSWAITPVEWAVDAGLISGVKKDNVNYLDPNGTATRAQATVMFKGFDTFRNQ